MRPPVPYHGSKAKLAARLCALFPTHDTYVEPFAGSASVLFHKAMVPVEVLNDLDCGVWSFFTALRDHPVELAEACRLTPYSRREFIACVEGVDEPGVSVVERARRWFTVVSQGFGSVPATRGWSSPMAGASSEAAKTAALIERFAACADRLRGVHLEHRPAGEVIDAWGGRPETLLYVDPPYLGRTRAWAGHQASKRDYRVELQTVDEHVALLAQLARVEAAVVLSGRADPLYDDLLPDWVQVDLGSGEVIWSNRPLVEALSLF